MIENLQVIYVLQQLCTEICLCQNSAASQVLLVLQLVSVDRDVCSDSSFSPAARGSHWAREAQPVSREQTKLCCGRHRPARELGTYKGWEVSGLWTPVPFRQWIKIGTFRLMSDWPKTKYFLTFFHFRIPWSVFLGGKINICKHFLSLCRNCHDNKGTLKENLTALFPDPSVFSLTEAC